jgi:hypothetical protein
LVRAGGPRTWIGASVPVRAAWPHPAGRTKLGLGGSLVMMTRPGVVADAGSLTVRYTDVDVRSGGVPGVPVVLRVRLTGRMRYGRVEVRA